MKGRRIGAQCRGSFIWAGCAIFCALLIASCTAPQHAAQSVLPPPLQYLGEWGNAGSDPGQLQNPLSFTTDRVGNVYIANSGNPTKIEKFDSMGHPLLAFDVAGNENNWDVAVDSGQAIFVVDVRRAQIQIFSPEGESFRTLSFRYRSSLNHPASIAIDPDDDDIYLADFGTGHIGRMNARGRILQTWGRPGGLPAPHWTPCRIRVGGKGNLFIADADNQLVEKLSFDADYVASWDFPFSSLAPRRDVPKACGLAVSQNFVVATDESKRLLEIWTLDGAPKLTVNFSEHPEWGQNASPTDVAFTSKGELLVLDRADSHVLRFRINVN
ncbi:MAG TPA: NHL repeat-containing protein [Candidatus Acidoferrales bacterium]|nr:NHL repeat-containing protein [Candidatus Acidoferrales bacterium]